MADKAQLVTTEDLTGAKLKLKDIGDGYHAIVMAVEGADDGGPGASGPDKELVLSQYRVKTAFAGAAVGDTVSAIRVLDLTTSPAQQSGPTLWYNETSQASLSAAPAAANLEPLATGGLTNAQFTAGVSGLATSAKQPTLVGGRTPVDGSGVTQPVSSSDIGTTADAMATSDTGTFTLIALTKRLIATLTGTSGKLPTTLGTKASGAALAVVLASDDAQIGSKVTVVAALGAGGSGIIGWLSNIWYALTSGPKAATSSLSVVPATDANVARETYSSAPIQNPATSGSAGATFVALTAVACNSVQLQNATTVDIEFQIGGAGGIMPVMAGTGYLVQGITNASQVAIRRRDQVATSITLAAQAFAV